jgi:hypothetical protein
MDGPTAYGDAPDGHVDEGADVLERSNTASHQRQIDRTAALNAMSPDVWPLLEHGYAISAPSQDDREGRSGRTRANDDSATRTHG